MSDEPEAKISRTCVGAPPLQLAGRRVAVTGARGFLGKHLVCALEAEKAHVLAVHSNKFDLREQIDVRRMYDELRPEVVIHAAAACGGIKANIDNPGKFLYENALMGLMLLEEGRKAGIQKFVLVSTACVYPASAGGEDGRLVENDIWEGLPHSTIGPYGVAKRLLHEALRTYRLQYAFASSVIVLTNLYGPGDHFGEAAHAVPMVVKRYCDAVRDGTKTVTNWGTGSAVRDWLFVEDAVRGILLAATKVDDAEPINIASGAATSIKELCDLTAKLTGYTGEVVWDTTKPDGIPRRYMDVTLARERMGFEASVTMEEGLRRTIEWFRAVNADTRVDDAKP
eukprot:TRINITY_DN49493_c0_g1_i1.p1 TRINITY_DN49493_c0_g1~~TRINITY_DN49493_c0_g1_i1.p1  ORF type:complete len:353 (-),score=50.84 TRINITY_DN49493_c0_g1_i1:43-1062(-)